MMNLDEDKEQLKRDAENERRKKENMAKYAMTKP